MKAFAIVPARASSKRFPRKNVALLGGKPLLLWTIEPALASGVFDHVWVSSEDADVCETARRAGAEPLARPPTLASDRVTVLDVCRDALAAVAARGRRYDALYVLIPATPFRTAESIRAAWSRFEASDADALLSVVPMEHVPQYAFVVEDGYARPWLPAEYDRPRPDLPVTWRHDGGHLILRADALGGAFPPKRTLAHEVTPEEAVDVNWPIDLAWAEFLLARRGA